MAPNLPAPPAVHRCIRPPRRAEPPWLWLISRLVSLHRRHGIQHWPRREMAKAARARGTKESRREVQGLSQGQGERLVWPSPRGMPRCSTESGEGPPRKSCLMHGAYFCRSGSRAAGSKRALRYSGQPVVPPTTRPRCAALGSASTGRTACTAGRGQPARGAAADAGRPVRGTPVLPAFQRSASPEPPGVPGVVLACLSALQSRRSVAGSMGRSSSSCFRCRASAPLLRWGRAAPRRLPRSVCQAAASLQVRVPDE